MLEILTVTLETAIPLKRGYAAKACGRDQAGYLWP